MHTPAYVAIRAMVAAMQVADLGPSIQAARGLARPYARLEKRRFQRTIDTLRVAFPAMGDEDARRFAMLAYEHLFQLAVELAFTPRLLTTHTWSSHVRLGNLDQAVRHLTSGRSSILITGHCGNWELLGHTMALLGFPMHALYRPLDLKPLDAWVRRTRESHGLYLLDKFGAAEIIPEIVKRREHVAFIADQNAGDRGLFVPFFGRLASTYKSIGLLAMQFEMPIICGQARRLVHERDAATDLRAGRANTAGEIGLTSADVPPDPLRYRIDVLDIILPEHWKDQPDPLFYISARYRRALEAMVRAAPEQNLWLHRYWKSRPRHEHLGKPLPASLKDKLRALPWMTDDELGRIEEWSARDAATLRASTRADVPATPTGA